MIENFTLDTDANPQNMNILIEGINKNEQDIEKLQTNVEGVSLAIGQSEIDKQDKGFGIGEQTVSAEVDLNKYFIGGKFITPQTGLINLPVGWSQGRHTIDVTGGEAYVTQIVSPDIGNSGQLPFKVAIRFGRGLNLTPIWSEWKEISWKETPKETIITTGLASGWSGSLVYSQNQENEAYLTMALTKSTDVGAGSAVLYTLPTGIRPKYTVYQSVQLIDVNGNIIIGSNAYMCITTNGTIFLCANGILTNARKITFFVKYPIM